jgi:alpha-tubulin suppressor-like RCC1 family protein
VSRAAALTEQAVGWGDNSGGQLSFPANAAYEAISAGGFQSLLSLPDGSILVAAFSTNNLVSTSATSAPVVALAAGYAHGLALFADGTVFGFGNNDFGQATPPFGVTNFNGIGAGAYHSLGVLTDGTVVSWGDNYQNHRVVPTGLSNVVAVAGGYHHSLALRSDGTVIAWGLNGDGQVSVPVGLSNVVAIAAGSFHSLALRKDGTVVAWGRKDHGQASVPTGASNVVAIAAGYQHSLALKDDGTVLGWGAHGSGEATPPASLTNAVALAAGYQHSLALVGTPPWPTFQETPVMVATNTGATVTFSSAAVATGPIQYQWQFNGQDLPGETNPTLELVNLQSSQVGLYAVIASANGYFVSARALLALELPAILDQPAPETIPAGQPVSLLVTAISSLPLTYQWQFNGTDLPGATNDSLLLPAVVPGNGGAYQVVVSTTGGSITSAPAVLSVLSPPTILSEPENTRAVRNDSATFAVGAMGSPPLSYQWFFNGSPVSQGTNSILNLRAAVPGQAYVVVTNPYGSITSSVARLDVALQSSVFVWGDNNYNESNPPPGLNGLSQLACGTFRVLALRTNGAVIGWGQNSYGQSTIPPDVTNASAVSVSAHNLVLKSDGTVASWGLGTQGQTNVPSGLSNVVAVSAGTAFSLALKADGTVVAWGDNSANQTNVPPNVSNIVAIAAGEFHAIALKRDGTVLSWGQTNPAYHVPPVGLSNVVAIACGYTHSLALRTDGTVVAWGQNDVGQLTIPAGLSDVIAVAAGGYDGLALKRDGTVVGLGGYSTGLDYLAPGLTNVALFSVGVAVGAVQFGPPAWPAFSRLPRAQVASAGETVVFSAVTSAAYPMRYQWQFNGINLQGETDSTLTLTNVQTADAGEYRLTVHAGGFVVSAAAQLAVNKPLLVISTSGDQSVLHGTNVTMFVSAVANSPITYLWRLDGAELVGRTHARLELADVQSADSGVYSVVLTAGVTSLELPVGRLTVRYPPVADPTPRNVTVNSGDAVTLYASASGPGPFTYQWTGFPLPPNPTNSTLVLTNVLFNGLFQVTIKNEDGVATNNFDITVLVPYNGLAEWEGDFAPIVLAAQTNSVSISAGYQHFLAAHADGTVQSFGGNDFGQATIPPGLQNVIAVAAGYSHSLALRSDGSVVGWGDNFSGQISIPAAASLLTAIGAGKEYSLGLRLDGTLLAWGDNTYGQTNLPAISGPVVSMSAGYHHALAILIGGQVVGWGDNSFGQATPPDGLHDAVAVAAGGLHSLALTRAGTIIAWGDNTYGQLAVPSSATNIVAVAAGYAHNLALRSDGTVFRWGRGAYLPYSTFVPATVVHVSFIAAGYVQCLVATQPTP